MPHELGLFGNLAISLVFASVGGLLAVRLGLPVIVGYLLAGVAIGPYTPGFIGDAEIAAQFAEIGVVLLMFGVGIHFSLRDLLRVWTIAVPGALGQSAVATALGLAVALLWGWSLGGGLVLGLAVAVASTVVLLRSLMERDLLDSLHGRIAVGWLIVEDLFTVFALVLLPALAGVLPGEMMAGVNERAGGAQLLVTLGLALAKVVLLAVLVVVIGTRAIPWLLAHVARTGSRELFTLLVLTVAVGIAFGASTFFGVSLALGAFLAGVVVSESDVSHQAAAEALPLRDAFAVLFFVSVGMLFNPASILLGPGQMLAVLAIIMIGKPLAAFLIVLVFGYPIRTGLIVAAGLAQIGEFSFILAALGRTLGLLPEMGYDLLIAGALLSILLNPLLFRTIDPIEAWLRRRPDVAALLDRRAGALAKLPGEAKTKLRGHAVLCGHGRVGSVIGRALERRGFPYIVIELN